MRRFIPFLIVIASVALVIRYLTWEGTPNVAPGDGSTAVGAASPERESTSTAAAGERTEVVGTDARPIPEVPHAVALFVEGRVVDAESGEPVADATVRAARTDTGGEVAAEPVVTDAAGRFVLRGASRENGCLVIASAPAHVARCVGAGAFPRRGLEIALLPKARAATLTGRVFDARAAPAEGARVRLLVRSLSPDDRPRPRVVETDADGRFALADLPPGRGTVRVEFEGHDDLLLHVDLPPGSRTDLGTLRLAPFAWSSITGVVRDADGAPVADAEVVIPLAPAVESRRARSDAGGRYRFDRLRAGPMLVRVAARGAASLVSIEVPAGREREVDLELPLGAHFLGGVVTTGGAPAVGFEVICEPVETGSGQSWTTRTDGTGRFRVDGLVAGPKLVNVWRDTPWKSEVYEGLAIDRDDHLIEFPPVPDPVRVEGTVTSTDGAPIAGALVEATGAADGERAHTDVLGRYALELRSTENEVRVLHATHPEHRAERRVVQAADPVAGVVTRDFRLTPLSRTGAVEGVVIDVTGRPVTGAICVVTVDRGADAPIHEHEDSDSRGTFRVGAIPAGPALLRVGVEGEDEVRRPLEIRAGATLRVEVRIERLPGGTLHVLVRDELGRPVDGVSVLAWRATGEVLRWGTADARGRLTLEDVRAGAVRVTAEAANVPGFSREVEVASGGVVDVVLDLQRGPCRLEGVLLRPDGAAARRVEIEVRSVDRAGTYVHSYLYSDHEGRFAMPNLPPGPYELVASTVELIARTEVTLPAPALELRLAAR